MFHLFSANWNIFIMAALKDLPDNSISIGIYWLSFHTIWDFPASWYDQWFLGVIRLGILFTPSVPAGFLWYYRIRVEGWAVSSLPGAGRRPVPLSLCLYLSWKDSLWLPGGDGSSGPSCGTQCHPLGGGPLLLGNGKSPDSLLASSDITPSGREEALHYYHVGVEVQAPHLVSTDKQRSGEDLVTSSGDGSPRSLCGLFWSHYGRLLRCLLRPHKDRSLSFPLNFRWWG